MSDYKQFRADFAKAAWLCEMTICRHGSQRAAENAVAYADALIAELERTSTPRPTPELPRLNAGWKWVDGDGTHKITPFDIWRENDGRLTPATAVGSLFWLDNCLATPDWHNPENIADPGEGWRFLVKGEGRQKGDMHYSVTYKWLECCLNVPMATDATYRTPATRPLPPVLAQDKEVQP